MDARILIFTSLIFTIVRLGFSQDEIKPDFSYLLHSYSGAGKNSVKLGSFDDLKPFDVPICVFDLFKGSLKEEWDYLIDLEPNIAEEYEKKSKSEKPGFLKEWFGPIVKINLPSSFDHKALYVLKIEKEALPLTRSWYFAIYDPKTDQCSSRPASVVFNEYFGYSFQDVLGDGGMELDVQTYTHNGTSSKAIRRFYSFGKDLSVKEIYAFVNESSNGMQTSENDDVIIKKNGKEYLPKKAIKDFDPIKAEEEFNEF